MTDNTPANCLRDLGDLVKRSALATAEYDHAKGQDDEQFGWAVSRHFTRLCH